MALKFNILVAASVFALSTAAAAQQTPDPQDSPTGTPPAESEAAPTEQTAPQPSQAPEQSADEATDTADQPATTPPASTQPPTGSTPGTAPQPGSSTAQPGSTGTLTTATAADVSAGATVYDPQGGNVGTVESVDADGAVVSTGTVRAKLPFSSFGKNDRGLVISLTRDQLNAAAAARGASAGSTPSSSNAPEGSSTNPDSSEPATTPPAEEPQEPQSSDPN